MKDLTTQSHAPHITNDPFPGHQGYKWTEVGVIPEVWEIQRLDAICSVYSGGTPSTARHDFYGGHIPWITSGDLNARRITEVSSYLTQAGFDSSAAKMIESGDLVVALYGATAGVVAITEIEAAINQAVLAIRTNRCDSEYLFHHLASRRNQIVATYTQGGQPNLSGEIIRSLVIVIPPLAEQRAIAEALSDVDGLLNALEALIAKKQAIKQATMQQLLTGRTRLPGFSGTWETKRLGEIAPIRNHKILPASVNPDTLCVELDHIEQESGQLLEYAIARNSTSSKYHFFAGDVLFGRLRPYLRKFWHADRNGICTTEIWPLMANRDQIDSGFLYAIVQSDPFIAAASISYGTHMPRADWDVMRNFEICLPEDREQRAIASVLSDMDGEIAALEQRRDKTRAIKQGMMQLLLTGRVRLSESRIRTDDTDYAD